MSSSSQFKDLNEFLSKHNAKSDGPTQTTSSITHTRIGDRALSIYGGSYIIPTEELPLFMSLYHEIVFVQKKREYLTERQMKENGGIFIDFDFRYNHSVESRQHTKEHIHDMILVYLEELKDFFVFTENKPFSIYIMEKPTVNRLTDGSLTKDGIHMIIGIKMDSVMQLMLRTRILEKLPEVWDMPLINDWDSVLDEGISKGTTNWQLYGSRKPGNQAYELTQHFVITYDSSDGEFMMDEHRITDFDVSKDLIKLSVQYDGNMTFEQNPSIVEEYQSKSSATKSSRIKKPSSNTKIRFITSDGDDDESDEIVLSDITNEMMLKKAMDNVLKNLKQADYFIKEVHEYAQILPRKYYEPGSHTLNTQVAFALKSVDERLFLSWVMLRSKACDFDYATITDLYIRWKKHFNKKEGGITSKSILYWAKQDAYDDYMKVKRTTVDHFIDQTYKTPTEFDFAEVLYHMFKDKYVCTSIINKTWYIFKNHRWELDRGVTIRMAISKDMYNLYQEKVAIDTLEMNHFETTDPRYDNLKRKTGKMSDLSLKMKKTTDKNNILREAMELFYDNEFVKNMDANPHLLCFTNGMIDFKTNEFRNGNPQDYVTKSTGIPYYPFDNKRDAVISGEILNFMEQLFPIATLNRYMWDHLASCLIGTNMNQTFNIYRGSGSNGKSILTDLMTQVLGEYKGTVPITLITEKRVATGGTSSEVMQLKGIRYAVMQEPSKDARINEGVMKEITGGDPLQARALYAESETFTTQLKLVVCTNSLFEINSNDDGTWRRIRICDFLAKFVDDGEAVTQDDTPYRFPKDKNLKEKLPNWAIVFASMLVKRAFETHGNVEDCDIVLGSSNKYRHGQDHLAGFVSDMIVKKENGKIKKKELADQFKIWFQETQGTRKMPKGIELYEFMDKKFGKATIKGWTGISIIYPDEQDELAELDQ